jgi:ribosomal protein S18 acetylase RimI-like enzyme
MEQKEDLLSGLTILPLTLGDLDAIVDIDQKVLGKARRDYWKDKIELATTHTPPSCLVAKVDTNVVGVIFGDISGWEFGVPDTIGWISAIGVDPAYQHLGIGRRLAERFVANVKSMGVNVLYTLVNWSDWDLLRFFRAMGFARGGEMINLELKVAQEEKPSANQS